MQARHLSFAARLIMCMCEPCLLQEAGSTNYLGVEV